MVEQILFNILFQVLYFVVAIYAAGFIIYLFNRIFYALVGHSRAVCYATGFLGTPVHELSHALLCLVFFHKINEIKFFQIDEESGTLGYVNHSYNPRNIYQRAGNYFIGIAPIVVGTLLLFLAAKFLLPEVFSGIQTELSAFSKGAVTFSALFSALGGIIKTFFLGYADIWWWVFMVFALCIALHMNLSGADIKGSLVGLPFVLLVIVALNFAFGFIGGLYAGFLSVINLAGGYLIITLALSLMFSAMCTLIALAVRGVLALFGIGR